MGMLVVRSRIDHFLDLLRVEIVPETRSTLDSLLVVELSQLNRDPGSFAHVERWTDEYRQRLQRLRSERDGLPHASALRFYANSGWTTQESRGDRAIPSALQGSFWKVF